MVLMVGVECIVDRSASSWPVAWDIGPTSAAPENPVHNYNYISISARSINPSLVIIPVSSESGSLY